MSFAGTAARGSAIPSPVEGMYTHLEDSDRLEFWNGSAWVSPFETTLLASSIFTSQTSVALDNIFTADYRFYDFYINAVNAGSASGLELRLRTGSSDLSSTTYFSQRLLANNTTVTAEQNTSADHWRLGVIRTTRPSFFQGSIANPFLALETSMVVNGLDGVLQMCNGSFNNTSAVSYNGIRFINPQSMTGSVMVYGRKA
jgi:hypothetical protein